MQAERCAAPGAPPNAGNVGLRLTLHSGNNSQNTFLRNMVVHQQLFN
jgi:hypothetical protein